MIKRATTTFIIVCVVMGLITSSCLAYVCHDSGITRVYNGSYWTEQAWLDIEADWSHNYYVTVYVKRNGTHYGGKTTGLSAGDRKTCYSNISQGTGGSPDWTVQTRT